MKTRKLYLSLLVAAVAAWACGSACLAAEAKEKSKDKAALKHAAPPPKGVRAEKDIQYVPGGDESQKLDLYLPEQPADKPMPLIVNIHGGGWRGGSKAGCPMLNSIARGYAVASVEYRFSQKALFPAQIQDCQAAIRWLRANSKKYNFDPEHIGVTGSSAGGHLVALVGTSGGKKAFAPIGGNEEQSDRVQAVCDFFGPTDFNTVMQQAADDKNVKNIFKFNTPADPYSCLIGVPLNSDKQKGDAGSPVHYGSKDNPPILILHGTYDALVPYAQSEELVAALTGKGVEVFLQTLPGSGHGGPAFGKPAAAKLIETFFDKYLKGADVKIELVPEAELAVPPPAAK
ncbi:MAG: alpha/beta hydrolase [Kiritimatiellaeota bacterium]|nr:alpha/beta hydrolase [Kiritimatiellota bacterium]